MTDSYVLAEDGKTPVRIPSILQDRRAWELAMRDREERYRWRVGEDEVGESRVSTVFLFLDHNLFSGYGRPLLWETMVFGGPLDGECERYASYDEALAGHRQMVERVQDATP